MSLSDYADSPMFWIFFLLYRGHFTSVYSCPFSKMELVLPKPKTHYYNE